MKVREERRPDHEVAVIGAGFSGIGAAIRLDEAGFSDYVVLEAGDGVGGAWHWNTYPGVAVDIPSFSYQFSFEQRSDWSRIYAPGRELKGYAEHCVEKYGLRARIRLKSKVVGTEFDETRHLWRIRVGGGDEITARFVIGATGVFAQPNLPDIPGVESFAGPTMHTARWDHDQDLGGKRVGIIGTGASAVQVIPEIAPLVERLVVFQRTPIWCLPKPDRPISRPLKRLMALPGGKFLPRMFSQIFVEATFPLPAQYGSSLPALIKAGERAGRAHLQQVRDPETREKLTPQYGLGCKRPSFHNGYLPTFNRDNVDLETRKIASITSEGARLVDGAEHELDVLVLATGFKLFDAGGVPPYPVSGIDGVDLAGWWDENRNQAYEGVSVPGFPNMFMILGPYGYNGQSYFGLIETQMRHIARCLKRAQRTDSTLIEIREEANARFLSEMLGRRHTQIFWNDTCGTANSYYFDQHGDVPFRASTSLGAAWRSATFDLDDYRFGGESAERSGSARMSAAGVRL